MDDVGDVTFELRRRLTTITAECDTLLTAHEDELSAQTTESVQRIDDQVRQLVTLISRLETAPVADEPIRAIDTDHSPHQPAPDELVPESPLVLSLPDEPFTEQLRAELETANRSVRIHADHEAALTEHAESAGDTHLVLAIRDILETSPPSVDAALSLLTPPEASEPILGASGILSPLASEDRLKEVLDAFHDPDVPTAPVAIVEPDADTADRDLGSALASIGRTVYHVTADEPLPTDVECILIPPELATEERLAELRRPHEGRRTPVVVLAEPPAGDWLPAVGGRTFVQRPPTAADFGGELLLLLDE